MELKDTKLISVYEKSSRMAAFLML